MHKVWSNLKIIFTLALFAVAVSQKSFGYQFCESFNEPEYAYNSSCYGKFSVGADWLYWNVSSTNLEFANHNITTSAPPPTTVNIETRPLRPAFDYKSGYRIFAGYNTCDCFWKLSIDFSHIPTRADRSFQSLTGTIDDSATLNFQNFPILASFPGDFLLLDSNWKATIDYLDLDVSCCFNCCDNLSFSPHVGIRNFWMHQSDGITATATTGGTIQSIFKTGVYGVGIEGGVKGKWDLCRGLSLIGNFGGSIMYSHFWDKLFVRAGITTFTNINHVTDFWRAVPMLDAFIGFQYDMCYCNYNFNVHVGWEKHVILDITNYSAIKGNITMQGLTLGGAILF